MKKALALLLALICAFSFCTVALAAEGDTEDVASVTVIFKDGDTVVKEIVVAPGTILTPYAPVNPEKADTDTTRYTFKGWLREGGDGTHYYQSTLPTPTEAEAGATIVYAADYAEEDISENQTFLAFFASIFDRINKIFEYFVKIFEGVF